MASIETFTKRLNGVLESIGDWFETVLKEDEEYEDCYREDYDSWPPEPPREIKVYDDELVAKAAEEYPGEWIEIDESYTKQGKKSLNKFAVKKDSNDDLFFKVMPLK